MEFPLGYRFEPTNFEIITKILVPKIRGQAIQMDAIAEERIYAKKPQSLNWNHVPCLNDYERYYFVKRTPLACNLKEKKNTKRTLESGEGYWRKSRDDFVFDGQDRTVGLVSLLSFFVYQDGLNKKRSNAVKTEFVMHEFSLVGNKFQEWVVCRIKDKAKEKNKIHRPIDFDHRNAVQELPQPKEPPMLLPPDNNVNNDEEEAIIRRAEEPDVLEQNDQPEQPPDNNLNNDEEEAIIIGRVEEPDVLEQNDPTVDDDRNSSKNAPISPIDLIRNILGPPIQLDRLKLEYDVEPCVRPLSDQVPRPEGDIKKRSRSRSESDSDLESPDQKMLKSMNIDSQSNMKMKMDRCFITIL